MIRLIEEAKDNFKNSDLNIILWRRFWQAINMHDQMVPYAEIKILLYGARTAENLEKRKIYKTILFKNKACLNSIYFLI